ncbi:MAG: HNH endonuclease [Shewanella oncorhynchi]
MNFPVYPTKYVYDLCVEGVESIDLVDKYREAFKFFNCAAEDYLNKACVGQLYLIEALTTKETDVVVAGLTRKQLTNIYSTYFVTSSKPARKIYDLILAAAAPDLCPFCGLHEATTVDHYLPKAKFPLLSIYLMNLVPACKDCNTGKGTKIATSPEKQVFHPYFDKNIFNNGQWLYARVNESSPPSISYYINPPAYWREEDKGRAHSHFHDFKLGSRFSTKAANELSTANLKANRCYSKSRDAILVKEQLHEEYEVSKELQLNHWKTAMYQALYSSDWYCDGGFLNV